MFDSTKDCSVRRDDSTNTNPTSPNPTKRKRPTSKCSDPEGCDRVVSARGLCSKHLQRLYATEEHKRNERTAKKSMMLALC